MEENKFIAYGKDDLTFSLNLQENKSEDWMADWSGRVVVEGKTYFLNGYIKKDGWILRLNLRWNKIPANNQNDGPKFTEIDLDDEPPFSKLFV